MRVLRDIVRQSLATSWAHKWRSFSAEDSTERRRVAVVGWELVMTIFPGRPAVGSSILLNGVSFDIIGVVAKVGREGNNGPHARIFIPIEPMRMLFPLKAETSG